MPAHHLGFLVPLGHDVLEGGAHHGALELLGAASPLLGHVLLQPLLVLPPVQHGPGDVPRVPLQQVRLVRPRGGELVALAVTLDLQDRV